jgi:putative redox protein
MTQTKDGWVVWKQGMAFDGKVDMGFTVPLDDGPTGFSPMELLLIALAGCTAMDMIMILQKKRQDITGFEVHAHGLRSEDFPKVFTDISLEYMIVGHKVDEAAVETAMALSSDKYCSVMAMLKNMINITTRYSIRDAG